MDQFGLAKRALVGGKHATALRLLTPLAEEGHAPAQTRLGELYRHGQGVARDHDEALSWFRKAADQGDADAQGILGDMFYSGEGVPRDDGKAARWYHQAADQSLLDAQFNLSVMYHNGQGVTQDNIQAHMWANIAGVRGHKKAREIRDVLAKQMTLAQIAKAQKMAQTWMASHSDPVEE